MRALERVDEDVSKLEVETRVEHIDADPTLLGRALANLIVNAKTHGRGLVTLRLYHEDGDDPGTLWFAAEDRGLGFTEGRATARNLEGGGARVGLSVSRLKQRPV